MIGKKEEDQNHLVGWLSCKQITKHGTNYMTFVCLFVTQSHSVSFLFFKFPRTDRAT